MPPQTSIKPSPETPATPPLDATPLNQPPKNSNRKIIFGIIVLLIIMVGLSAGIVYEVVKKTSPVAVVTVSKSTKTTAAQTSSNTQGVQLVAGKNYGNKYANGLLPVGDGKYTANAAKVGYIDACSGYAKNITTESGGAGSRGPWFTNNTEYDVNKKLHVQGSVMWSAEFSNKVSGATRTIVTNDLPTHPTGTFPISPSDPAYAYDRNPNTIKGQSLTYSLAASPTYGSPQCMGGSSGIMLTGVALFNGFDAGGRDAGAWEVQDSCDGHPQSEGLYHYHTLSSCIKDVSVKTVIGYALDGFPITGPNVGTNNILTTSDLDECHGLTSSVVLDGKIVTTYHYVMTEDFPYSVSCFRATPIQQPGMQSTPPSHP